MSLPVVERIARVLISRIESVTLDNGYNQDVGEVIRPKRDDDGTPDSYKVVVNQLDRTEEQRLSGNPVAIEYKQPFQLLLYVRPSDHEDIEIDALINLFESDVMKAITDPYVDWHNFADEEGATAVNAEFDAEEPSRRFEANDGTHEGVTLLLNVYYRVPENDPYTVRL